MNIDTAKLFERIKYGVAYNRDTPVRFDRGGAVFLHSISDRPNINFSPRSDGQLFVFINLDDKELKFPLENNNPLALQCLVNDLIKRYPQVAR